MTSERSKHRDFLSLSFITKSISKKLLIYFFTCKKVELLLTLIETLVAKNAGVLLEHPETEI